MPGEKNLSEIRRGLPYRLLPDLYHCWPTNSRLPVDRKHLWQSGIDPKSDDCTVCRARNLKYVTPCTAVYFTVSLQIFLTLASNVAHENMITVAAAAGAGIIDRGGVARGSLGADVYAEAKTGLDAVGEKAV